MSFEDYHEYDGFKSAEAIRSKRNCCITPSIVMLMIGMEAFMELSNSTRIHLVLLQ